MKIDGRSIAQEISQTLQQEVHVLVARGCTPHLAVIQIGDDDRSSSYIRQKQAVGMRIGAAVSLIHLPADTTLRQLKECTQGKNQDPSVHGIIIQRPTGIAASNEALANLVVREKDVDSFRSDSPFFPPIAQAVLTILEHVCREATGPAPGFPPASARMLRAVGSPSTRVTPRFLSKPQTFSSWLSQKRIVVIGRGETAGKPIVTTLQKKGYTTVVIDSKTLQKELLIKQADIVISCVGKSNIVRHHMVGAQTIVLGVGMHMEQGKLEADYDEEEIAATGAYYTPVPGGVGPVNVACLFQNLIKSAQLLVRR